MKMSKSTTTAVLSVSHGTTKSQKKIVTCFDKWFPDKKQSTDLNCRNTNSMPAMRKIRRKDDHSLLKFLALNALELSAPASDVLLRQSSLITSVTKQTDGKKDGKWFQLSGHPDCFAPAGPGTIWKKCSGGTERTVYEALSKEPALRGIIPRYLREVQYAGETFIELEDLLHGFHDPHIMDIKMGTRTFLESEVQNTFAREDLYKKMISVDPNAPTPEERKAGAVTKLRYMQFREEQSSTSDFGFRIEAIKFPRSLPVTDLKKMKSLQEISNTLSLFLEYQEEVRQKLINRIREIRTKLEQSHFFSTHELVGSSILIIYDDVRLGVWLIDFAKTRPVPENGRLSHRRPWTPGNHEEGFLFGIDQLLNILESDKIFENKKKHLYKDEEKKDESKLKLYN